MAVKKLTREELDRRVTQQLEMSQQRREGLSGGGLLTDTEDGISPLQRKVRENLLRRTGRNVTP